MSGGFYKFPTAGSLVGTTFLTSGVDLLPAGTRFLTGAPSPARPAGLPDEAKKLAVWQKAFSIDLASELLEIKRDRCGAHIKLADYGNRYSEFGWEIDHIVPLAKGGRDELSNLQPLHWRNNAAKADGALCCATRWNSLSQKNWPTTLATAQTF